VADVAASRRLADLLFPTCVGPMAFSERTAQSCLRWPSRAPASRR
jgi:hypothetical protein